MRIAIFTETFSPDINGVVTVLQHLLRALHQCGAEVIVFTPGTQHPSEFAGFPIYGGPAKPSLWYADAMHSPLTADHYRILRDFKPDIIHIAQPLVGTTRAIWWARRLGVPLVISFHTNYARTSGFYDAQGLTWLVWFLTGESLRRADCVLVPSSYIETDLQAHGVHNTHIWRQGVEIERFHPRFANPDMRYRLSNGHPDDPLLLYVGRLAAEKRILWFQHVLEALPQVRIAIVGDGPQRAELEAAFDTPRVTLPGPMKGDDLSAAFASADCFVFPTSSFETFGLVTLEALASGVPVVASAVGGAPDVVQDGINGFTFAVDDLPAFVDAVQRVVLDDDLRARLTAAARPSVLDWTWQRGLQGVIQVYENLIAAPPFRWWRMPGAWAMIPGAMFMWQVSTNEWAYRRLLSTRHWFKSPSD